MIPYKQWFFILLLLEVNPVYSIYGVYCEFFYSVESDINAPTSRTYFCICFGHLRQYFRIGTAALHYHGTTELGGRLFNGHGFGSRSIAALADKHGGQAIFNAENGIFTLKTMIPLSKTGDGSVSQRKIDA